MSVSDLERLPYDVFALMVENDEIDNKDLLRLCNSSPILNKHCNKDDQLIFRKVLKRRFGITDTLGFEPRACLKLLKFSFLTKASEFFSTKLYYTMKLLVPDIVIEKFAEYLNIPSNLLMISNEFLSILSNHLTATKYPGGIQILKTSEEGSARLITDLSKSIGDDPIIPILFEVNQNLQNTEEILKLIKYKIATSQKREEYLDTYVIIGIIIIDDQLQRLKDEFFGYKYIVLFCHDDMYNSSWSMIGDVFELSTNLAERLTQIQEKLDLGTVIAFNAKP